jgi:hypothetical protein
MARRIGKELRARRMAAAVESIDPRNAPSAIRCAASSAAPFDGQRLEDFSEIRRRTQARFGCRGRNLTVSDVAAERIADRLYIG